MTRRRRLERATAAGAGAALLSLALAGAAGAGALGLRAGFSVSPGQWVVGLHDQVMDEDAPVGIVTSAEVGFGLDTFTLTGQGDAVYRFRHATGPRPYVGFGGAVYWRDPKGPGSEANSGLNLVGGVVLDPHKHTRVLVDGRVRLTNRLPKARVVVAVEF